MNVKNEIPTGRTTWIKGTEDPMPNAARVLVTFTAKNP